MVLDSREERRAGARILQFHEAFLDPESIPLLASLSDAELSFLRPRLQSRSFESGDIILAKGSYSDGLYVIMSGLVGVSLGEVPGAEEDIAALGSGECIGEMSLMNGEPCSATIHALVDTETLLIERADFPDVVEQCPTLWRNLSSILSRRLVRTNRRLTTEHRARVSALLLLMDPPAAATLAALLGFLLASHTEQQVFVLDAGGGDALLEFGSASKSSAKVDGQSFNGLRQVEITPGSGGGRLHLASWQAGVDDASMAGEEHRLREYLKATYDQVILVCDGRDASMNRAWWSQATSSVIVAPQARFLDAARLAKKQAGVARHRVDAALMSDVLVTSDNQVGGLWEASIVAGATAMSDALAGDGAVRFRFIPRDPGLLCRVRTNGVGVLKTEADGPFLQAISRLARRIGGMEIGLALGAGMAKGFSHIGVLRAFQREGVPIDYLAGSSIGSIVGSVYAGGMVLGQLEELMTGADKRFVKLTLPIRSVSSNRGLRKILTTCHERASTAQFPELFIPFAAVATDVDSGREVVLRDGVIWSSVLASISMPGIFPPIVHNERVLVDGGLVNPVPSKTVRDMGADIVIGVDLAASAMGSRAAVEGRARVPNIIEMLWRTMEIMLGEITSRSAANADVTIRPNTGHSQLRDFSRRGQEFIAAGDEAAVQALPEIAALLPSVKVRER